jgi:sugar-specific transcriptional regulator TrmB
MIDTSVLEGLGLTKGEVKTYLSLLELGPVTAGHIIEKSGLQSSVVYNCLHKLIEQGLVTYIKKGAIKYYQAADPSAILNFIDDKKRAFSDILPELKLKQTLAKEKSEAEIVEGIRGMEVMFDILIKEAQKGDEYLFFSLGEEHKREEIQRFFQRVQLRRIEKGLRMRGIAPAVLKSLFQQVYQKHVPYMRFADMIFPTGISILNNHVITFVLKDKIMAIHVHSKAVADVYKKYFEDMWQKAKG